MFNNHDYYVMFKMFIIKKIFGFSCWETIYKITNYNQNGSYIYYPNEHCFQYDPDFNFLSPVQFPPRLTS